MVLEGFGFWWGGVYETVGMLLAFCGFEGDVGALGSKLSVGWFSVAMVMMAGKEKGEDAWFCSCC